MNRRITRFRKDDEGDWTAILDCGHPQHVRHNPPFTSRPWVVTEAGRKSRLGETLNCVRCDRFDLPAGFVRFRKTPAYTESSMPREYLGEHTTATVIWGRIVVLDGKLSYHVEAPATTLELTPEQPGIIIPRARYHFRPDGRVRFFIEFYRSPNHE